MFFYYVFYGLMYLVMNTKDTPGKGVCPNKTFLNYLYIYNFMFTQDYLVNKSAGGYRWRLLL
jgi:hypothetical protein